MMGLLNPGYYSSLRAEHLSGKWWRLTEPLIFCSEVADIIIRTPAGFVTDFASVPRLPLAYWLFGSRANRPAVTHDDLYRSGMLTRKMADRIFLEAMKTEGYRIPTRYTMYGVVRLGGRWSYKNTPGCLDPRDCPGDCSVCEHFDQEYYDRSKII
jgi:hypothetical protein